MNKYRLDEAAGLISGTLYDWLKAEVETSGRPGDVNSVLDDYDQAVTGLRGGFNHPTNFFWNKFNGHMDRLESWVRDYSEIDPTDEDFDNFAVKVTFGGLMEMSGCFRAQCYVVARNAQEYLERRKSVTDINLTRTVTDRLTERIPNSIDLVSARIDLAELERSRKRISDLGRRAVKRLCSMAVLDEGNELGQLDSRSANELRVAQAHWLDFTVDSIVMTAKLKGGDLEAAPFWEPVSITEQSGRLYYPMREPIDWAEVIAA